MREGAGTGAAKMKHHTLKQAAKPKGAQGLPCTC